MTLSEKVEVLKDAGFTIKDDICGLDIKCGECPVSDIAECLMALAVQKLIKAGYDIVIQ